MTDNEIIKALECCNRNDYGGCDDCPFYHRCVNNERLSIFTLALINRQKAEIERLKGKVDMYEEERKYHFEMSRQRIAEGIKEFAERIKLLNQENLIIWNEQIDNLAKEMVGDGDG